MALFLGLTPCKGEVNFDDINLTTESVAAPVAKQEILPPRLPLPRIKETFFVDLSKVANRALADQEDNDGKGGWTDQGAAADMRLLATGERLFGGVRMKILPPPKSIVVLKGTPRKAGDLPDKVTIPVGRKVDSLFFLHACAWTPETGSEAFSYVLHYKDGKTQTISVVSGQQVTDWAAKPVQRFPGEQKTFTTVADTVPNPQFGQGSVYRMEWNCPTDRRAVELESIEFIGNPNCVPVLLAITGVMEW
jgi:beta-galactosidase